MMTVHLLSEHAMFEHAMLVPYSSNCTYNVLSNTTKVTFL